MFILCWKNIIYKEKTRRAVYDTNIFSGNIALGLKSKIEIDPIQQSINDYSRANVFSKLRNAFLGSSGKKVWSAALLTKLSADIGISAFAFPRLADLLNKGEFGLLAIGGSMFLVSVLAHTTWFSLMLVNSLSALFIRHKAEQAAELSAEELPNVTVQIPCRNEPFEIMKNNSIQSALALDYPREKLTIQVIDNSEEGRYTELQEYCAANGIEFLHRVGRDGGKARNLNIGLGLKPLAGEYYDPKSDLYFLIDSDIEFPPDILRKSLPEFNTNPRLPFVIFEADDLADNNLFNSSLAAINMAAQHNVVGIENAGFTTSGGYGLLYNRQAWNVIGGWKENFVGEDWATGIALRTASEYFTKGKRVSYVKVIDHTPEDLNGFKIQQQRWAKGGVETTLKLIPALLKAKHIPWNEKIDILVRYSFYSTMVFSLVILPALTAIVGTALSIAGNASMGILSFFVEIYRGFFIPMLAAVGINTVFAFLRREKSVGLKNLLMFMPSLFAYGGVGLAVFKGLVQGLYDKKKVFNVTPKTRLENKGEFFRIIRQNWKEITFGAALLGVGVFTLPYYLQFVALVGLSFIISPFMSLVKFNKKDKPERK